MHIANDTFERILDYYVALKASSDTNLHALKTRYAAAFKEAIEFIENNIKNDIFNLSAIGSENATTEAEQRDKFALLSQFLDAALIVPPDDKPVKFNSDFASGLKAVILDPKLAVLDSVYVYDSYNNMGIREKYSQAILTAQHWLTDLDLQRMLKLTDTASNISIIPFTAANIGTVLHFKRKAHIGATSPYTISFLLNRGSEGEGQGIHWLAATVTVNPLTREISYQIDDSLALTAEQKAEYQRIIEAGINYRDDDHQAFSPSTLKGEIIGHDTQKDRHSCGYRALHRLFQDKTMQEAHPIVKDVAAIDASNSDALVAAFYRYQLENFSIPKGLFTGLTEAAQAQFSPPLIESAPTVTASKDELDTFILSVASRTVTSQKTSISDAITEFIGSYTPALLLMHFPGTGKEDVYDNVQYTDLFEGLSQEIHTPLPHFVLDRCDIAALDGLQAFYGRNTKTLFKKLTMNIDLPEADQIDAFVAKLKFTLNNLSRANVSHVVIKDEKNLLKETHLKELTAFIKAREIDTHIDLPKAYQETDYQRQIDKTTAMACRKKNSDRIQANAPKTTEESKKRPIRTRQRIDLRAAMKIDVELQESVDATINVERQVQGLQIKKATEYNDLTVFSHYTFEDAVEYNRLDAFKSFAPSFNKQTLTTYWDQLLGNSVRKSMNKVTRNMAFIGISEAALTYLMKYQDYFQDGINIRELPQGFMLLTDPKEKGRKYNQILHYDSNLEPHNTIAPQPVVSRPKPILNIDFVERLLANEAPEKPYVKWWQRLQAGDSYSREATTIFRQYLPELMTLTDTQLATIAGLCGGEAHFNWQTLEFIFKNLDKAKLSYTDPYDESNLISIDWVKDVFPTVDDREAYSRLAHEMTPQAVTSHPLLSLLEKDSQADLKKMLEKAITTYKLKDTQFNGLLSIYNQYGPKGIEKILTTWETATQLPHISMEQIRSLYLHVPSYESIIMNDDVLDAVRIISGFTPEQRQWWTQLYKAHRPIDDDLRNLVKSFTMFSRHLAERGLSFYSLDESKPLFKGAGNLPTTLGRINSILSLCKEQERQAQWQAMSRIDLSAQGALLAMTLGDNKTCGFVLPEMDIDPRFAISSQNTVDAITPYDTVKSPMSIQQTTKEADRLKAFYRYIAHQKYRMPLTFYQENVQALETIRRENTIPTEAVDQLYRLLAEVTTGDNYYYSIPDEKKAEAQWKNILTNMSTITLPSIAASHTPELKRSLIAGLADLSSLPSLPILDKLVELVTKPLQNLSTVGLFALQSSKAQSIATMNLLVTYVQAHGSALFQGMRFYQDSDFDKTFPNNRNILEQHLHISKAFIDAGVPELLPFISTFSLDTEGVSKFVAPLKEVQTVQGEGEPSTMPLIDKFNKVLLDYALKILLDIDSIEGLNPAKLQTFLNTLTTLIPEERRRLKERYRELTTHERLQGAEHEEFYMLGSAAYYLTPEHEDPDPDIQAGIEQNIIKFGKKAIHTAIEAEFAANLPKGYFTKLEKEKPKDNVKIVLDKAFKDEEIKRVVDVILAKFTDAPEAQGMHLIRTLAALVEGLTLSEKRALLSALSDERLLATSIENYNELLLAIHQQGNASFIYFMQAAEHVALPIEGLAAKVNYFLSEALPQIRRRESNILKEIETVELVTELVLAADEEEISAEININPSLTAAYAALEAAISSKNIAQMDTALTQLKTRHPDAEKSEAIRALSEHLEWAKREEYETVHTPAVIEKRTERVPLTGTTHTANKVFTGWFREVPDFIEREVIHVISPEKTERKLKIKALDDSKLKAAQDELRQAVTAFKSYTYALERTFDLIEDMVKAYPAAKSLLLSLSRHYLSFSESNEAQIKQAFDNLERLHNEFIALGNQDLVISLCEHFGAAQGRYSYKNLLAIVQGKPITIGTPPININFGNYPGLSIEAKKQVLTAVSSLLNNDKPCSLQDIQNLIDRSRNPIYVRVLEQLFKNAPFPTIDIVDAWFDDAKAPATPEEKVNYIVGKYTEWNKKPVAREEDNGFNLAYAKTQAAHMYGVSCTEAELATLAQEVERVRTLDTKDLLAEIKTITTPEGAAKLVALMAELLYRTKGLPQVGVGADRESGHSFEINTTQYLALYTMLKTGGHVTSQIGTGEGKSRIMMIAVACQYAMGNTVDFVTSDLSLATRDYLEYQSFFKVLGAKTNLIYAQTPANQYRLGGINFSDAANLSLFRGKARTEGNGNLVIAEPEKRSLMVDEADKLYFDLIDTRFNYSAQADPSIRDMSWIYELLVEFFSKEENVELYYANADACNEAFYAFARGRVEPQQFARLVYDPKLAIPVITRNQFEAWQSSALTALALDVGKDYVIKPDVTIQTKHGPKVVSQAQLVVGHRASDNAKFSFGVHQCLHARLNLLKRLGTSDKPLGQALAKLKHDFYIDPENQIVYSSTSKSLLDDYVEGSLLAVTGTAGAIKEREEARALFGQGSTPMTFIDVPRHHGQQRIDLPVLLAKNSDAHQQKILASIRESLGKNPPQPVLLICEDDTASEALYNFLDKNLNPTEKAHLARISANTSIHDEGHHVKTRAGQPGAITVSTAMLGRGTDIKLHADVKDTGLNVVATYLPRERDYSQIIGRAGRFGDVGQSKLIIDVEKLKERVGARVVPVEFYTATEAYLKRQQNHMDIFAQQQRVIKSAVGDFRLALTNQYFDQFFKPLNQTNTKEVLLQSWQKFFDKTDKKWNEVWPNIVEKLSKPTVDIDEINTLLVDYRQAVSDEWQMMRDYFKAQIEAGHIKSPSGIAMVDEKLRANVGDIILDPNARKLLQIDRKMLEREPLQTIIANKYDEAYLGRAVIYTNIGDRIKSFFANAWRGEFPNLKAVLNGNMSWRQFFFGSSGTPLSPKTITIPDANAAANAIAEAAEESSPLGPSSDKRMKKMGVSGPSPSMVPGMAKEKRASKAQAPLQQQPKPKDNTNLHTEEETPRPPPARPGRGRGTLS